MEAKQSQKERLIYFDLLRIAACFSVIVLHVSSQHWYYLPVTDFRWLVCNTYDALFRFGVPVFVMISGALFLGRAENISLKHLFFKNILRLLTAYIIWSAVYAVWGLWGQEGITFRSFLNAVVLSKYHLWFVPMMIQIYILVPILAAAVRSGGKKLLQYAVLLFVFTNILPATMKVFTLPEELERILNLLNLELIGSYVGYFLLGCYLYRYPPKKEYRKWIYLLGLLGAAGAAGGSAFFSRRHQIAEAGLFDSFSIFTFFLTCALFVFFVTKGEEIKVGPRTKKLITNLSLDTFGIYLVHILLIEFLFMRGIDSLLFNNILCIPALAVFCFVIGALLIGILRRIPFVGKYIC